MAFEQILEEGFVKVEDEKKHWLSYIITFLALALVIYHIVAAGYKPLPGIQHRVVHIGLGFSLIWLCRPWSDKWRDNKWGLWLNLLMVVLTLINMVYVVNSFESYADRVGLPPTTADMILGTFTLLCCLEAARRATGNWFLFITIAFVAYAMLGRYIPQPFTHGGMDLQRMVSAFYITLEGVYGVITGVSANYILLYIVFAAIIRNTAVGGFIINIAMGLVGMVRGGPAKMAVIASSMMGMVTGSSMANVAGVGSFTIPLMKSIGYRKEFAAGVEACSGMGAQIMPPVMGGSVFIMMEILGIAYWKICIAAFPIAILYYIGLFFAVDYEAVRQDLKGLDRKTLPSFWRTLIRGWYLVLPIVVLIYLLITGVTPQKAAFYAILTTIVIGVIPKDMHLNFKKLLEVLETGAKDALVVIGLVSAASLIQGITTVTGLGLQLSTILIDLARGNLFALLLLTSITSIILGLGLPIMVCYTLLAVLVAPALIKMGILPIAAHMFIFYYGVLATISPPVAPDCFVAAGIAGADVNKTMWESCRIAVPIFMIPFLFAYSPIFILQAKAAVWTYLWVYGTGILGIYAITSGLQGVILYANRLNYVERIILFIAGLLLIAPLYTGSLIGLIVLAAVQGRTLARGRKYKSVKGHVNDNGLS